MDASSHKALQSISAGDTADAGSLTSQQKDGSAANVKIASREGSSGLRRDEIQFGEITSRSCN